MEGVIPIDFYHLTFRRAQKQLNSEFSMDGQMLSILLEMDGKKSIGAIAKKMNLGLDAVRDTLLKLTEVGLVEPVEDSSANLLDKNFFNHLRENLLLAIGPFADILIDDVVADMGHSIGRFPSYRAQELVSNLAKEIQREDRRTVFAEKMKRLIQESGYNE